MQNVKQKTLKVELSESNIRSMIDLHINNGTPFKLTASNYSTEIISDMFQIRFLKNAKSNSMFAAFAKVQRDVKEKPVIDIDMKYLKYYQTNFNFPSIYADKLYNIDIKSAYATILYNEGYLSKDTYDYLSRLPKQDRLSAVGMLAGKKHIFYYNDKGEQISFEEIANPNAKYFFYAVYKTFNLMDYAKMILGNSFCFSWVDSVYFTDGTKAKEVQDTLLKVFNVQTTFAELTEFEVQTVERKNGDKHYQISFIKDGKKKSNWSIPYPDFTHRQYIYNYLLQKAKQ